VSATTFARRHRAGEARVLHVLDREGQALAQTVELPGEVFDASVNVPLLHQVVVAQLAAARAGTHDTKTRGEVSGGGKKPYRQKGTGRARQGSIRAPQFVGGGTVHGPTPHGYEQKTPKKMKAAALRGALSDRARGGRVHVVQGFVIGDTPSTKAATAVLRRVASGRRVLVVADRGDVTTWKSLRNAAGAHLIAPGQLNTYDVLVSDDVVFTEAALAAFLAGPPVGKSRTAIARSGELEAGEPTVSDLAAAVQTLGGADAEPTGGGPAPAAVPTDGTTAETGADTTGTTGGGVTEEGTGGETRAAGEGLSDEELVEQVAGQTSSDLEVEDVLEREAGGTSVDAEIAKADADEIEEDGR